MQKLTRLPPRDLPASLYPNTLLQSILFQNALLQDVLPQNALLQSAQFKRSKIVLKLDHSKIMHK